MPTVPAPPSTRQAAPAAPANGSAFTEADWNTNVGEEVIRSTENPWGAYGACKALAEEAAWAAAKKLELDLVAINPGLVWGPACASAAGSTSAIVAAIVDSGENSPFLDMAAFAMVDVRDVGKAMIAAAFTPSAEGRYIVAHTDSIDTKTLNSVINEVFPQLTQIKPCDQVRLDLFGRGCKVCLQGRVASVLIGFGAPTCVPPVTNLKLLLRNLYLQIMSGWRAGLGWVLCGDLGYINAAVRQLQGSQTDWSTDSLQDDNL